MGVWAATESGLDSERYGGRANWLYLPELMFVNRVPAESEFSIRLVLHWNKCTFTGTKGVTGGEQANKSSHDTQKTRHC